MVMQFIQTPSSPRSSTPKSKRSIYSSFGSIGRGFFGGSKNSKSDSTPDVSKPSSSSPSASPQQPISSVVTGEEEEMDFLEFLRGEQRRSQAFHKLIGGEDNDALTAIEFLLYEKKPTSKKPTPPKDPIESDEISLFDFLRESGSVQPTCSKSSPEETVPEEETLGVLEFLREEHQKISSIEKILDRVFCNDQEEKKEEEQQQETMTWYDFMHRLQTVKVKPTKQPESSSTSLSTEPKRNSSKGKEPSKPTEKPKKSKRKSTSQQQRQSKPPTSPKGEPSKSSQQGNFDVEEEEDEDSMDFLSFLRNHEPAPNSRPFNPDRPSSSSTSSSQEKSKNDPSQESDSEELDFLDFLRSEEPLQRTSSVPDLHSRTTYVPIGKGDFLMVRSNPAVCAHIEQDFQNATLEDSKEESMEVNVEDKTEAIRSILRLQMVLNKKQGTQNAANQLSQFLNSLRHDQKQRGSKIEKQKKK
jgi:outer membrane biosynthesis protein TonB